MEKPIQGYSPEAMGCWICTLAGNSGMETPSAGSRIGIRRRDQRKVLPDGCTDAPAVGASLSQSRPCQYPTKGRFRAVVAGTNRRYLKLHWRRQWIATDGADSEISYGRSGTTRRSTICSVLRLAWHVRVPERRSAKAGYDLHQTAYLEYFPSE